jgi:Arc/MetJ family transcription regulator
LVNSTPSSIPVLVVALRATLQLTVVGMSGELGTGTKKATVNAALRQVADQARRREALAALKDMDFSALEDTESRERVWGTL